MGDPNQIEADALSRKLVQARGTENKGRVQ